MLVQAGTTIYSFAFSLTALCIEAAPLWLDPLKRLAATGSHSCPHTRHFVRTLLCLPVYSPSISTLAVCHNEPEPPYGDYDFFSKNQQLTIDAYRSAKHPISENFPSFPARTSHCLSLYIKSGSLCTEYKFSTIWMTCRTTRNIRRDMCKYIQQCIINSEMEARE